MRTNDGGEMTNDETVRRDFTRRIMNDLAATGRSRELVAAEDGTKPVLFALDHERLSDVLRRARAAGDRVNLFVALQGEGVALAHLVSAEHSSVSTPNHLAAHELHDDLRIGMFIEYALATGAPLSFAIRLRTQSADVEGVRELLTA